MEQAIFPHLRIVRLTQLSFAVLAYLVAHYALKPVRSSGSTHNIMASKGTFGEINKKYWEYVNTDCPQICSQSPLR